MSLIACSPTNLVLLKTIQVLPQLSKPEVSKAFKNCKYFSSNIVISIKTEENHDADWKKQD